MKEDKVEHVQTFLVSDEPEKNLSNNLELLNDGVQRCMRCKLHELVVNDSTTADNNGKLLLNNLINNASNDKILFVGLNPSYRRFDPSLRAFRGIDDKATLDNFKTSGDLFMLCLKRSKLVDYDIWVTNLLKCSTVANSVPTEENLEMCYNEWLVKELQYLKPKVVVCMGSVVYKFLVEKKLKYKVIKMYHPSYAMRDRSKINILIEQLNGVIA